MQLSSHAALELNSAAVDSHRQRLVRAILECGTPGCQHATFLAIWLGDHLGYEPQGCARDGRRGVALRGQAQLAQARGGHLGRRERHGVRAAGRPVHVRQATRAIGLLLPPGQRQHDRQLVLV